MATQRRYRSRVQTSSPTGKVTLAVVGGVALLLLLGAFTFWTGGQPMSRSYSQAVQELHQHAGGHSAASNTEEGVRAITPTLKLNAQGRNATGLSGAAGEAAYTSANAVTYSLAHPSGFNRPTSKVVAADVTAVFMTDAEADTLLRLSIGLAPTAIVCIVQTSGTFNVHPMAYASPGKQQTYHITYAYRVFDGTTGNMLVETGSTVPYLK
jgi:hypothetical protein